MQTILEPQRETPVQYEADVIVVGGGPSGIGAALAAARNGVRTILIERFGCLGGSQTLTFSTLFCYVDPNIQGGIVQEIVDRLGNEGAEIDDIPDKANRAGWGPEQGVHFFDGEYYKFLLDNMVAEAGVKVLFHSFAVGAIREGDLLKGIVVESREGRFAVLGKVIIDCTGIGDIVWKSGAPSIGEEGFPDGPYKGQHMGYGWAFYISGIDTKKFRAFAKAYPEEWDQFTAGRSLITKAKAEGKVHVLRCSAIIRERDDGRAWVLNPSYTLQVGQHPWMVEAMTAGEIDLRRQGRSLYRLLKENVPGFENSIIDQTPVQPLLRDGHRILGEHVLTETEIRKVKTFDDSIAVSNMAPDLFYPDGGHRFDFDVTPYDVPYRCLISKRVHNLLAAGSSISVDLITWAALRYNTPSVCTGQAAGTAAALSIKNNVTPKALDVRLLQSSLRKQGMVTTVRQVPAEVMKVYQEKAAEAKPLRI